MFLNKKKKRSKHLEEQRKEIDKLKNDPEFMDKFNNDPGVMRVHWKSVICWDCKHWDSIKGCRDFISTSYQKKPFMVTQTNKHNTPLPDQISNLVFEPRTKYKTPDIPWLEWED